MGLTLLCLRKAKLGFRIPACGRIPEMKQRDLPHVKLQVRVLAHLPAGWWLPKRVGFNTVPKSGNVQQLSSFSISFFPSSKLIYLLPILSSFVIITIMTIVIVPPPGNLWFQENAFNLFW